MPRIHDPDEPAGGPGSAFLSTGIKTKGRRRRKKRANGKTATSSSKHQAFIGEDLLDWQANENEEPNTVQNKKKIVVKEKKSPVRSPARSTKKTTVKKKKLSTIPERASSPLTPQLPVVPPQKSLPRVSNTSRNIRHSHARHALLVDTRGLDTLEGSQVSQLFLENASSFLSEMATRGACPCIVGASWNKARKTKTMTTTTTADTITCTKAVRISQELQSKIETPDPSHELNLLPQVLIQPPAYPLNGDSENGVKVPSQLSAQASWKLLTSLVVSMVEQDKLSRDPFLSNPPLDVTILTNDVAMFCDSRQDAHISGVGQFWIFTRDFFQTNSIRSIDIRVVATDTVVWAEFKADNEKETAPKEEETAADVESMDIDEEEDGQGAAPTADETQAILSCMQSIKEQLASFAESDRKDHAGSNQVSVSISLIGSSASALDSIGRNWIRRLMTPPSCRGRITFELPETFDGTQCAVCLDTRYKIMPFRTDSLAATGLLADLQLLTAANFQVVQLVPLDCIDGSLLFGTPIAVRAAFDTDLAQFNEMKGLVSFLLNYLAEKKVALLLQSSDTSTGVSDPIGSPLYHTNGQTFLLMTEDVPGGFLLPSTLSQEGASRSIPSEAVLFRCASAAQMLDLGINELVQPDEVMKPLADYVENSLDLLDSNDWNPLLMAKASTLCNASGAFKDLSNQFETLDLTMEWNDDSGVGALPRLSTQNAMDDLSDTEQGSKLSAPNDLAEKDVAEVGALIQDNKKKHMQDGDSLDDISEEPKASKLRESECQSDDDEEVEWNDNFGVGAARQTALEDADVSV